MNRSASFLSLLAACLVSAAAASPADATRIEKEYQLAAEKWALQIRLAATPEERATLAATRPDPREYARRMWQAIGSSLDQEWTIAPASWFLRLTSGLPAENPGSTTAPAFASEADAIRTAVEKHHLASNLLTPFCLSIAVSGDPRSLALLEKIESTHANPKIQGVAALGSAMLLKTLGDDGEIMRRRLTLLRKAIIQSADVEYEGTTVAKLAEDELYIIRYLTKGRVAPDLQGVDSANRPLKLSDHKGKVIVLLFWGSAVQEADRVIAMAAETNAKFRGRPFVLIGVNHDPVERLRALQADGTVSWPNFSDPENKLSVEYRVGSWPLAYVLDQERKIQFAGPPGSFVDLTVEALLSGSSE